MIKKNKIPRRKFFKILGGLISIPTAMVFYFTSERRREESYKTEKIFLPPYPDPGATFLNRAILVNNGGNLKVFNSSCTHLGCKINRQENNDFVCPCHGSRYDLEGNVIKGPTTLPLNPLKIMQEKETGRLYVVV